ncbi:DNA-binding MarR family transcriptional regulator [Stackebrandtia endophytica]|uniref:DNA-binding MarR family transcriptional regulator n=1 Tax=Stackebrandtia endophytica TaxID=1496996 RepID=A0A543AQV4_9ACTN|nr:MarR family transcriptional regulator [Stackebrandtia endophytica]TQL74971.1 DNA-binding MarR family transcriptional regulator [Stackebrandtia endophytica]
MDDPRDKRCRSEEAAAPLGHLLYRVSRAHRLAAGNLLRQVGLFPGQEIMLSYLAEHGDQRQSSLVLALSIDPSTVTKMLQRLQRAELVARRPCPEDGRVSLVSITEKGRALTDAIVDCWRELEARTTAGMTEPQKRQLAELLGLVDDNLAR